MYSIYGELGRMSVKIYILLSIFCDRFKILNYDNTKSLRQIYNMMLEDMQLLLERLSWAEKGKRKVQGVPQSQTAALPRHQEEEETDKSKQAQTEQTYEKH